jgi:hypothetical protein
MAPLVLVLQQRGSRPTIALSTALSTAAALTALVAALVVVALVRRHRLYREARQRDPALTWREYARRHRLTRSRLFHEDEVRRADIIRKSLLSRGPTPEPGPGVEGEREGGDERGWRGEKEEGEVGERELGRGEEVREKERGELGESVIENEVIEGDGGDGDGDGHGHGHGPDEGHEIPRPPRMVWLRTRALVVRTSGGVLGVRRWGLGSAWLRG